MLSAQIKSNPLTSLLTAAAGEANCRAALAPSYALPRSGKATSANSCLSHAGTRLHLSGHSARKRPPNQHNTYLGKNTEPPRLAQPHSVNCCKHWCQQLPACLLLSLLVLRGGKCHQGLFRETCCSVQLSCLPMHALCDVHYLSLSSLTLKQPSTALKPFFITFAPRPSCCEPPEPLQGFWTTCCPCPRAATLQGKLLGRSPWLWDASRWSTEHTLKIATARQPRVPATPVCRGLKLPGKLICRNNLRGKLLCFALGEPRHCPVRVGQHTYAPLLLPRPGGSHADIISRLLQNILQIWAEPAHATEQGREPAGANHRCALAPPQRSGSICLPGIRFPDLLFPPGRGCYKAGKHGALQASSRPHLQVDWHLSWFPTNTIYLVPQVQQVSFVNKACIPLLRFPLLFPAAHFP